MLKALTELCMQKSVPNFTVGPGFVQLLVWVFFPKSIILGSLDFYECIQLLFLAQSPSFQGKWSHFIKAELLPSPKQNSPFLTPEIPCAPFSILKKSKKQSCPGVSLRASVNPSTQLSEGLVPALTFAVELAEVWVLCKATLFLAWV